MIHGQFVVVAAGPGRAIPGFMEVKMTRKLTGWETTRLSKHFILLDFLAGRAIYRSCKPLVFDEVWNDEFHKLAKGLCKRLLEPLITAYGPISVADAFWPRAVADVSWPKYLELGHGGSCRGKHRWEEGEATVDIALYEQIELCKQVDGDKIGDELRNKVTNLSEIGSCRDRVLSYPDTEFLCVTFKSEDARKCGSPRNQMINNKDKRKRLRAHHVRVGRHFNMLDFCRNGRAVEEGRDLVHKALDGKTPDYQPIAEEKAARSFAAALDPLVDRLGRVSVVRGMETADFSCDEHADLHRWDQPGPWRLVFVLPQKADPEEARDILKDSPHFQGVLKSRHASDSWALALIVEQKKYGKYCGLRPKYPMRGADEERAC